MRVYYFPNADGTNSFMVAAKNQKEACRLMGGTVGDFKRYGGCKIAPEISMAKLAMDSPGIVFTRPIGSFSVPWKIR